MSRIDARPDHALLVRALGDPARVLPSLTPIDFRRLIDAADQSRLLGWLLTEVEGRRVPVNSPLWLQDRLVTVEGLVRENERAVRWEIDRIARAFAGSSVSWLLLKGAGYVAAGLPCGRGRRVADIDVLVPETDIAEAERLLNAHGWHVGELDAYDERYYREWMHELPPMVHDERRSVLDLHHAILPRTSRLAPDTARLLAQARAVDGGHRVLCPAHMVLHAAAHLFHDGEIAGAIRDVVDLDQLLRTFGGEPAFWTDLLAEARGLGLTRPAYYALRYANRTLGTAIPSVVEQEVQRWAPAPPVQTLMDVFVERALGGSRMKGSSASAFALYLRSHWLRMPPVMLARHLLRKSIRRN